MGLWILGVTLLWAVLWVAIPAWSDSAPSGDNVEQLVWSQGLEWGYHKHPPLPTWILIAASQLFTPGLLLTYLLSIAGMLLGAGFLWRLVAELLGRAAALPAVLATGCIAFYSYRAHIYNHNTVLIPIVYASAWLFLRAVRTGRLAYWAWLGVACACGMLTKYQFAVVLVPFAFIALRLRAYRDARALRGALLALVVATVLLIPHILWLVRNDFPPFRYASQMVLARLTLAQRVENVSGFALQQVRDSVPAVLLLVLAAAFSGVGAMAKDSGAVKENSAALAEDAQVPRRGGSASGVRVWIVAFGFGPALLMIALGLFAGVRLENHWGTMALQFAVLPLLLRMRGRARIPALLPVLFFFCLIQAAEGVYDVAVEMRDRSVTAEGGRVRAFDPRTLTRAVEADWRRITPEPLRYVVGSTTWGGFIALYSHDHPRVLISGDPSASPWVSLDDLARCGGVYIDPIRPARTGDVEPTGEWDIVDYGNAHKGKTLRIRWTIVPPTPLCRSHSSAPTHASLPAPTPTSMPIPRFARTKMLPGAAP